MTSSAHRIEMRRTVHASEHSLMSVDIPLPPAPNVVVSPHSEGALKRTWEKGAAFVEKGGRRAADGVQLFARTLIFGAGAGPGPEVPPTPIAWVATCASSWCVLVVILACYIWAMGKPGEALPSRTCGGGAPPGPGPVPAEYYCCEDDCSSASDEGQAGKKCTKKGQMACYAMCGAPSCAVAQWAQMSAEAGSGANTGAIRAVPGTFCAAAQGSSASNYAGAVPCEEAGTASCGVPPALCCHPTLGVITAPDGSAPSCADLQPKLGMPAAVAMSLPTDCTLRGAERLAAPAGDVDAAPMFRTDVDANANAGGWADLKGSPWSTTPSTSKWVRVSPQMDAVSEADLARVGPAAWNCVRVAAPSGMADVQNSYDTYAKCMNTLLTKASPDTHGTYTCGPGEPVSAVPSGCGDDAAHFQWACLNATPEDAQYDRIVGTVGDAASPYGPRGATGQCFYGAATQKVDQNPGDAECDTWSVWNVAREMRATPGAVPFTSCVASGPGTVTPVLTVLNSDDVSKMGCVAPAPAGGNCPPLERMDAERRPEAQGYMVHDVEVQGYNLGDSFMYVPADDPKCGASALYGAMPESGFYQNNQATVAALTAATQRSAETLGPGGNPSKLWDASIAHPPTAAECYDAPSCAQFIAARGNTGVHNPSFHCPVAEPNHCSAGAPPCYWKDAVPKFVYHAAKAWDAAKSDSTACADAIAREQAAMDKRRWCKSAAALGANAAKNDGDGDHVSKGAGALMQASGIMGPSFMPGHDIWHDNAAPVAAWVRSFAPRIADQLVPQSSASASRSSSPTSLMGGAPTPSPPPPPAPPGSPSPPPGPSPAERALKAQIAAGRLGGACASDWTVSSPSSEASLLGASGGGGGGGSCSSQPIGSCSTTPATWPLECAAPTSGCILGCDGTELGLLEDASLVNRCAVVVAGDVSGAAAASSVWTQSSLLQDSSRVTPVTPGTASQHLVCVPGAQCFSAQAASPSALSAFVTEAGISAPAAASAAGGNTTTWSAESEPRSVCCAMNREASLRGPAVASWDAARGCRFAAPEAMGQHMLAADQMDHLARAADVPGKTSVVMAACPLDIDAGDGEERGYVVVHNDRPGAGVVHVSVHKVDRDGFADPAQLRAVCNVGAGVVRPFRVPDRDILQVHEGEWVTGELGPVAGGASCFTVNLRDKGVGSEQYPGVLFPGGANPKARRCFGQGWLFLAVFAAVVAATTSWWLGRHYYRQARAAECLRVTSKWEPFCGELMAGATNAELGRLGAAKQNRDAVVQAALQTVGSKGSFGLGLVGAAFALGLGATAGVGWAGQQGHIGSGLACSKCNARPRSYPSDNSPWQFGGEGFWCRWLGVGCKCNNAGREELCKEAGYRYNSDNAQSADQSTWSRDCCEYSTDDSCAPPRKLDPS